MFFLAHLDKHYNEWQKWEKYLISTYNFYFQISILSFKFETEKKI